jgi:transposase
MVPGSMAILLVKPGRRFLSAIPVRRLFFYLRPPGSGFIEPLYLVFLFLQETFMKHPIQRPTARPAVSRSKRRGLRKINPDAAGIDIGSTEHYVAVPEDRDPNPVRVFGCLTPDLHEMAKWLIACGIKSVAMESTGVYWIPVAQVLDHYGLEVLVVDAAHVKNVPSRKTDVVDCQWIQELHSFGLLRGAFRPDKEIQVLRSYWRWRQDLVEQASRQIQLMQKSLEQMNLQLHKVLSDITGVTGLKIIRDILAGNRDPVQLACLKHPQVKSSAETVAKALTGDYHDHHLFTLRQAVELYDIFKQKIAECDQALEAYMGTLSSKPEAPAPEPPKTARKKTAKPRKNQVHFDLKSELIRLNGVDLTAIDGIDTLTAQTLLAECGRDTAAFPTEKHFASWLGLCPNNRITGGKVKRTKTRKVRNRAATALRIAAQSLHHSQSALGAFYRRMNARLGVQKAVTATAHKLARLVYRMLKYGQSYVDQGQAYYEQQYQERLLYQLKKKAKQMGFELVANETGELVS